MENTISDTESSGINDYRGHLASKWKRFVNYLTDTLLISFLFGIFYSSFMKRTEGLESVLVNIYALLVVMALYFFSELYSGKTLGKLITGTKVISTDNGPLTARQIFLRTLARIVPFEPFSILFGKTAWHDDWTDTAVVNNSMS